MLRRYLEISVCFVFLRDVIHDVSNKPYPRRHNPAFDHKSHSVDLIATFVKTPLRKEM
jgi:hypothetical protein